MKIFVDDIQRWQLNLSDAHYVWERADLLMEKEFNGLRSGDCSRVIRQVIDMVMDDPQKFISVCGYFDLRGTMSALMDLFFILRERPEGIVRAEI